MFQSGEELHKMIVMSILDSRFIYLLSILSSGPVMVGVFFAKGISFILNEVL